MSTKPYSQQHLDNIKKRQLNELTECPKAFFQLISFMQANLRKQFKSFSLFNLCQGSTHKLRFNDVAFQKAFASMTISQRLQFYQRAVAYGIQAFGKGKKPKEQLDALINQTVSILLPEGYKQMELSVHQGFRSDQHITVRIQKFKISSRNHFHINLQNYLLRQSTKTSHPQTYVLEAINKSHPQRVRFAFVNAQTERKDYETLKQLAELAFRNTVNSMILPDMTGMSPSKLEKKESVRKSMGRLAEPLRTEEQEFSPLEEVAQTGRDNILGGSQVLQFSRHLAEMKREGRRPYPDQSNNILGQFLSMKSPRSSGPQSRKNLQQAQKSQNIFNKVLQGQSDIKMAYNSNDNYNKTRDKDSSPIRGFVSSQVKQYTGANTLRQVKYKNVFQHMLPEFNLRQLQASISSKTFKQIYMSTNTTILQHSSRPQRFQLKLIIQNIPLDEVYHTLINQQLLKRWNTSVDESQIKITLSAQNCLICYEKHKRFSTWFKQRDYLFLRHAFTYRQCKYIADKSIEHTSFIPFQSIQRGYIRHIVTRLREVNNNHVEIVVDISVQHGGYLGVEKRKQLNLAYLKHYENLQKFIKKERTMLSKIPKYCHNDWSIDWIDQNNGEFGQRSQSLKTEDFLEGSQIDQIGIDNVQLQSQDFYSIQDQDQIEQQQTQPSYFPDNNNFQFQTTQGFEQQKNFAKKNESDDLVEQKQVFSELKLKSQSIDDQLTMTDPDIVLDEKGYCILPQKYYKKKHPIVPKENNQQDRHKVYDNIVMKGDFVENKDGGILLVNKAKIDAQNNVINFIMKTMRKNLLSGKSILSISLPVEIFKADSNTQRLCESMTMGPVFLQKAAQTPDPLQRMKLSICFALSNSLMYFDIEKPFNPILGQTYQGMIDGCPIYAQQVSHHPPVTSLYFVGRGFRVHASVEAKVFLHMNSGDGVNQGFYSVVFEDGHVIKFQTAPGQLSGFTIGDRKYRFKDKMYVYDKKHSYFSIVNFQDPNAGFFSKSKWTYPDQMQGQIMKVSSSFINKFQQSEQQKLIPKGKQIEQTLSKISGRWIHYLKFDEKQYYNIQDQVPYRLVNYDFALNSDARYREDLVYRVRNDLAKSQIYKEELENKQRKDRKLREQYTGKGKH